MLRLLIPSFIIIASLVMGQSTETGGTIVVPPSPNAGSLAHQSNESVQMYTGSLNVKIPIFDLMSRDLSHSVYLSYNGAGNRVNDLASWVGLGWRLNAGGVIARTMRSLPDEYDGTMYLPSTGGSGVPAKGWLHPDVRGGGGNDLFTYFNSTSEANRKQLIEYSNKTGDYVSLGGDPKVWDTEPDEFHFNFGEYSGKFIFDQDGQIQIIPRQNLEITKVITSKTTLGAGYPSQQITSFQVKDPNGVIYTFGNATITNANSLTAVETTAYSQFSQKIECGYFGGWNSNAGMYVWDTSPFLVFEGSNGVESVIGVYSKDYQTFTSSWYLTKIESTSGDVITLSYSSDGEIKFLVSQNQDMDQVNLDWYSDGQGIVYGTYLYPPLGIDEPGKATGIRGASSLRHQVQNVSLTSTYNRIQSKRLSSIQTSGGSRIDFTATNNRQDLAGGRVLNEISVRDLQGITTKRFVLDFVYTGWEELDEHVFWFPFLTSNGVDFWPVWEYRYGTQEWADNWAAMATADHFRLFLKSIKEIGGTEEIKSYDFDYNFDEILPRRLSYNQDWFGYYTHNPYGHLIPKTSFIDTYGESSTYFFSWQQGGATGIIRDPNFNCAYRTSNLTTMKAGILTAVKYPTGGKKEFIYDRNVAGNATPTGGLAIKEIRAFADATQPTYESTFYNYFNGTYARSTSDTKYLLQLPTSLSPFWGYPRSAVSLSSSSITEMYTTKGSLIGYQRTEESKTNLGKTVYHFSNPTNNPNTRDLIYQSNLVSGNTVNGYAMNPMNDLDHKRGNLLKVEIFDNLNRVLSRTTNVYNTDNTAGLTPITTTAFKAMKANLDGIPIYMAGFYKYANDWVPLTQTITEVFDQSDPGNELKRTISTTDYSYLKPGTSNADLDLLPRKITQTLADGGKIVSETKYPRDYSTSTMPVDLAAQGIHLLKSKKIENTPIESIQYLERPDGTKYLIGGSLYKFKEFQAGATYILRFWESYKMKPGSGNTFTSYSWSSIDASNVFTWPNSPLYKLSNSLISYDAYGNLTSEQSQSGIQANYAWGYNNSLLTNLTKNTGTYQHSTNFTYQPTVGLLNSTDINGRLTNFVYDNFERLKLVKDHSNNIETRYRYHYKGTNLVMPQGSVQSSGCRQVNIPITFTFGANTEFGQTQVQLDFGDGASVISTTGSVTHAYSTANNYVVKATFSNPEYFGQTSASTSITVSTAVTSAEICADGTIEYDVCGSHQPVNSQCDLMSSSSMSAMLVYPGGISLPTLMASSNGSPQNYQWQYNFNNYGWQTYGGSSSMASAPPNFGNSTPGSWEVRCIISDNCGNQAISNTVYLNAYASTPNCPIN